MYETSLVGTWFLQSSGDDGIGRRRDQDGCGHAYIQISKGGWAEQRDRGHLQTVQSEEIKANKQGTKPDLLCVFSTSAGLRKLVQICSWNTILRW